MARRAARQPRAARSSGSSACGAAAPGVLGWLTTTDHKRIGILYFWTTLVLFGVGGAEALLMRTQLAQPERRLVSARAPTTSSSRSTG